MSPLTGCILNPQLSPTLTHEPTNSMHFKPTAIPQPGCRKGYGRRAPHCTDRVTQEGWKRKRWHESKTIHNLWPKRYDFTSSCFWKLNGSVVTHYRCPPGSSNPRSCAQATNPSPRMTQPLHSLGLWQIHKFRSTPLLLPTSPTSTAQSGNRLNTQGFGFT